VNVPPQGAGAVTVPNDTVPNAGLELTVHAPDEISVQVDGSYSTHPIRKVGSPKETLTTHDGTAQERPLPDAPDAPVLLAPLSMAPFSVATLLDFPLGSLKMPLGVAWAAAEPQQTPSQPSTAKQARTRRIGRRR
jgi:hypothetical protein